MSKWSSTTAYAALIIAVSGFVLAILALVANAPITAAATAIVAHLGANAANEWSYYFRDKEAAERAANAPAPTPTVVVNNPVPMAVS
jgi:hypothetical protein